VFLFTVAVALILMSPYEAAQLGRSALAATLSASNILFWKTSGYFDLRSEYNPLLMTWSLAVEEQFYMVIPLLMVLLARVRRQWLLPSVFIVSVLSFLFAVVELGMRPTMVFYTLPPRAWELSAGVTLAILELGVGSEGGKRISGFLRLPAVRHILGWVGFLLILTPVFLYTVSTPFPGFAALPPVLGAAMLLAASGSWINTYLLSIAPLRFVGRISYSLYLWHWPLLAFGRVVYGDDLPLPAALVLIAFATVAAVLSYYFIEQPFRKSTMTPRPLLLRYGAVSVVILLVCAMVWRSHGFPQRFPELARKEASGIRLASDKCLGGYGNDQLNVSTACYDEVPNQPVVALWGDSHSAAMAPGLRPLATAGGYGFVEFSKSSCPPLLGATRYIQPHPTLAAECISFNHKALDAIQADHSIRIVVLAGYWSVPFHGMYDDGWLTTDTSGKSHPPTKAAAQQLFRDSLATSIRALQAAGKQVIVFDDVPSFEKDPLWRVRTAHIPLRHKLAQWLGWKPDVDPGSAPPITLLADAETSALLRQTIAAIPNVELVDPAAALCNVPGSNCNYRDGDRLLYMDTQHLSADGARYALRNFRLPAQKAIRQ
jgi:peptidoglycan/LPS O-acetylase OafA/YrhL